MVEEYFKKLVLARLKSIPPNISFSIMGHGEFTRDELIAEVLKESEVGKKRIDAELRFIRAMPRLVARLNR